MDFVSRILKKQVGLITVVGAQGCGKSLFVNSILEKIGVIREKGSIDINRLIDDPGRVLIVCTDFNELTLNNSVFLQRNNLGNKKFNVETLQCVLTRECGVELLEKLEKEVKNLHFSNRFDLIIFDEFYMPPLLSEAFLQFWFKKISMDIETPIIATFSTKKEARQNAISGIMMSSDVFVEISDGEAQVLKNRFGRKGIKAPLEKCRFKVEDLNDF